MIAKPFIELIRQIYGSSAPIPLHRPVLGIPERKELTQCIDSNFVSSVGESVDELERRVADYVGAKFAVAVVNGTNALQVALRLVGVERNDEVITQPLSFVATCNSISYLSAMPVFVDVDPDTLGMSPDSLEKFLKENARRKNGETTNRTSGRKIAACVPMHTFGHAARITEIAEICAEWDIPLVEDAAESLGSFYLGRHTGTFGHMGVFSFNGNKIITTGGGGMIVTDDENSASRAKHLTTTAKVSHPYEYVHDEVGYNFRMPNLNAALGCAQINQLNSFVAAKRAVADQYARLCDSEGAEFFCEPENARSNYWLNSVVLSSREERDAFLKETNDAGVMTRPVWRLMPYLPMYAGCQTGELKVSRWFEERIVCLPSSVP